MPIEHFPLKWINDGQSPENGTYGPNVILDHMQSFIIMA